MSPADVNARDARLYAPILSGHDALILRRVAGNEGLSRLFEYEVELQSESEAVDLDKVLGKHMCLGLDVPKAGPRFLHGYVSSFSRIDTDGSHGVYRAVIRPDLWRLTRTLNCRVFQNLRVPDIVDQILREHGITDVSRRYYHENRGPYLPWEYCVQYRETDFAFISRLMEHEGIHYFFKHEQNKHVLVLADSGAAHASVPGYEEIEYRSDAGDTGTREERIWGWQTSRAVLAGAHVAVDFDYLTPNATLMRTSGSEVPRKHEKAVTPDYEIYNYPEQVVQQTGYSVQGLEDYARIRTESLHADYEVFSAETDTRVLQPGVLFKLLNRPRGEAKATEYLVVSTAFGLSLGGVRTGDAKATEYTCSFHAINSKHVFRPPRTTPKPVVAGPQSAIVVGGAGEQVWTDELGRVRIQFPWDRKGKKDGNSSCWVRVAQAVAGANWGALFLPHVGQEVLVGFLDGDPDRPVVIGSVYNGRHKPPVELPANRFKSVIRDHFGNEIVLDGTPGAECMSLHSPSKHSVLQLGKSANVFTHSKMASYSFDSESYFFGTKISFTKGMSLSLDRGMWFGAKLGVGASVTVGAELSASGGSKLSLTAGGNIAFSMSWSCAWGYARELKYTKGTYRRSSSSDVLMDSQKSIFITGGENDNTMLMSNDEEMTLSFDDSTSTRAAEMAKADAWAKAMSLSVTTAIATAASLGVWGYQSSLSAKGPVKDKDAKTEEVEMDYKKVSGLAFADAGAASAAAVGAVTAVTGFPGQTVKNPEHKEPSAKILLRSDLLKIFAGRKQEAEMTFSKDAGITIAAQKDVTMQSDEGAMMISAKKELKLHSDAAVNIDAVLKHKNMTVLK